MRELDTLKNWIRESNNIVFFGGAGTSTASGIPDFRSASGLYNQKNDLGYPPEYLLSHDYLVEDPDGFSTYYKENLIYPDALPNILHEVVYDWEKQGKLLAIITQNIDRLHQKAGNERVIEIHGNLEDHYCTRCGKKYYLEEVINVKGAMKCEACGGFVRPDVTLYGEALNEDAYMQAIDAMSRADLVIVAGTSLVVYPAAGLVRYYRGERLAVINRESVPMMNKDAIFIQESLENVFQGLKEL